MSCLFTSQQLAQGISLYDPWQIFNTSESELVASDDSSEESSTINDINLEIAIDQRTKKMSENELDDILEENTEMKSEKVN